MLARDLLQREHSLNSNQDDLYHESRISKAHSRQLRTHLSLPGQRRRRVSCRRSNTLATTRCCPGHRVGQTRSGMVQACVDRNLTAIPKKSLFPGQPGELVHPIQSSGNDAPLRYPWMAQGKVTLANYFGNMLQYFHQGMFPVVIADPVDRH